MKNLNSIVTHKQVKNVTFLIFQISLGGPLFYTNKLIAIYGSFHISNEEGSEYRYKNISSHMEFINRFAPIQEYDMFIHDPMFPMPE